MNKKGFRYLVYVLSMFLVLTGVLSFTVPATASAVAETADDPVSDLVSEFMGKTACSNVSVVVYDNGEVTYYGDKDKLYQIGSMTKAFTGLAIRKLIDEGKISEDDVISAYIPGFTAYCDASLFQGNDVSGTEDKLIPADITVRDLLEQKSGFTNNEKDYPSAKEGETLKEWADSISGCRLKSVPGSEYAYSNVNFNLLGLIIENISGRSYREYMEEEILTTLGLENTYVGMPAAEVNVAKGSRLGYRHAFDYEIPVREGAIPAGYFYSNTEDMGRWLELWIGNDNFPAMDLVRNEIAHTGDYYAGWEMFDGGVIGHSGGTPNYSSRIVFYGEKRIGVCVLTNLNVAASTDSLCNGIYDIVCDKDVTESEAASQTESSDELNTKPEHNIATDVWTVFDIIFTCVSATCVLILILSFFARKKGVLIVTGVTLIILLTLIIILFPMIFGASLYEILFKWAPISLAGGLIIMTGDIIVIVIKLIKGKKN